MERDTPAFKVNDNGSPIADDVVHDVMEITVDEPMDQAAVATVTLRDDHGKHSDGSKLKVGNELKIELGYMGSTQEVFVGEITGWKGAFPRRGCQTLTVLAEDKFHRLRRNRRQKAFLEMKDADAVQQVASAAGLSASCDATPVKHDSIFQWNQTDADFILERARLFGYEVFVEGKSTLKFRKPDVGGGPVTKLELHKSLRSFCTAISLSQQQKEVKVTAWDMMAKAALVSTNAKKGDERGLMGGSKPGADVVASVDGDPKWFTTTPAKAQDEVDAYAKGAFQRMSERFLEGEGTSIGDPKIRRGKVIELAALGNFLSGNYYVQRALHSLTMGFGYTTQFRVIRTAVQAPAPPPPPPQRQTQSASSTPAEPPNEPVTFEVGSPSGAPLGGANYVLVSPGGQREAAELSSDGKVEVEFESS